MRTITVQDRSERMSLFLKFYRDGYYVVEESEDQVVLKKNPNKSSPITIIIYLILFFPLAFYKISEDTKKKPELVRLVLNENQKDQSNE